MIKIARDLLRLIRLLNKARRDKEIDQDEAATLALALAELLRDIASGARPTLKKILLAVAEDLAERCRA